MLLSGEICESRRSAHGALRKARQYVREGYRVAVDIDLAKFFDTVNHDVLIDRVAKRIRDKRVLRLIGQYLRAGVVKSGRLSRTLATQTGMTNQWLKDQGLVLVKELWVNIHYPATAR